MDHRPRLQLVVAHPDDETFGCGSLLLHAAAAGAMTAVVCATRGEAGGDTADLAAVRERELREAAALLGVQRVDLLDFADSGMAGDAGPHTLVGAGVDEVRSAVQAAVAAVRPDVLVTLDASDSHRDHVRIRDAAVEAARLAEVPRIYLACLPRSLMRRWVEHVRTERPDMEHLDADTAAMGTPDEDLTTVIDATEHRPARERAIAIHASQTSPFEGLPPGLRAAFLDTVHLRRVHPAWTGGARETGLFPPVHRVLPDAAHRRSGHPPGCWWDVVAARWICRCRPAGFPR